jgi:hypothetical protein
MRPDDVRPETQVAGGVDVPIDVDLAALDADLTAAGAHARRSLYGRTQPTRVFSVDARARLLGRLSSQPTTSGPRRPPS